MELLCSLRPVSSSGDFLLMKFKTGTYRSTKTGDFERYESSYELRRFKALDASPLVKKWGRSKERIHYRMGKKRRHYHPDIFVVYHDGRIFIEEVKGHIWDKSIYIKKKLMAEWHCRQRGWIYRVIFKGDLETVF